MARILHVLEFFQPSWLNQQGFSGQGTPPAETELEYLTTDFGAYMTSDFGSYICADTLVFLSGHRPLITIDNQPVTVS